MGTYTIACKSPEQFHIISVMVSKDQPLETAGGAVRSAVDWPQTTTWSAPKSIYYNLRDTVNGHFIRRNIKTIYPNDIACR